MVFDSLEMDLYMSETIPCTSVVRVADSSGVSG